MSGFSASEPLSFSVSLDYGPNENRRSIKGLSQPLKSHANFGAKLTKAEKQIFALEEGLTALSRRLRQLEEAVENWGIDGREQRPAWGNLKRRIRQGSLNDQVEACWKLDC